MSMYPARMNQYDPGTTAVMIVSTICSAILKLAVALTLLGPSLVRP